MGVVILTNAEVGKDVADTIYKKILELWFTTNEEADEALSKLNVPGSETEDYPLSEAQKIALSRITGRHRNDYGYIEIKITKGSYFFGTAQIISTKENGDVDDITLGGDMLLKVGNSSFAIYSSQDKHEYVFEKVEQ